MGWTILQTLVNGIVLGIVYAGVAVGFNVIWRSGRVFNIAIGEMFVVSTFLLVVGVGMGANPWIMVTATALTMVALGAGIERVAIRPLVGQSPFTLLMATLATLLILRGAAVLFLGPDQQLFPRVLGDQRMRVGELLLRQDHLIGTALILALILGLAAFFRRTRLGLLMTAVAEDHQIARSLGIKIHVSMALSWMLAGISITVAMLAYMGGRNVSSEVAIIAFAALPVVLLAGLETISGLIPAGIIVGVAQAAARTWLDPYFEGGASLVLPYLLMLVVLLVFPHGMFGWRDVERI